ncbi:MAG: response regulator receiver domain protein [Halonotius sp. J07HN6]|jgi:Response regulator receiver domain.|nr:MAG: response regulator receiver domain protein [Halonotius sp. J07HN6]
MGVPPANRLLLVSDSDAIREAVTEAVRDPPDLRLTTVETPADARCHLAATPADCLLVDAHASTESLSAFRDTLRAEHPTLPFVAAVDTARTLPASLAVHATIHTDSLATLPEVVRVLTATARRTDSPAVSAEHS